MNIKKQNGMTGIGWLLVIGLVVFTAILALRIFPIVMESFKVKSALKSMLKEPGVTRKTNREIISLLDKRFAVDDVTAVKHEHIFIERPAGKLIIEIKYENRKALIGNFDIIGKYNERLEVIQH